MTEPDHFERFHRLGWSPVRWAHHPPAVRQAIRAARMRPKLKGCFENAGRLVVCQRVTDLLYVEGWVTSPRVPFPFQHAWVEHEGRHIDITITDSEVRRLEHWTFEPDEVRAAICRGWWGPIDEHRFRTTYRRAWASVGVVFPWPEDQSNDQPD